MFENLDPAWVNTILLGLLGAGYTIGKARNGRTSKELESANGCCQHCVQIAGSLGRIERLLTDHQLHDERFFVRQATILEELLARARDGGPGE